MSNHERRVNSRDRQADFFNALIPVDAELAKIIREQSAYQLGDALDNLQSMSVEELWRLKIGVEVGRRRSLKHEIPADSIKSNERDIKGNAVLEGLRLGVLPIEEAESLWSSYVGEEFGEVGISERKKVMLGAMSKMSEEGCDKHIQEMKIQRRSQWLDAIEERGKDSGMANNSELDQIRDRAVEALKGDISHLGSAARKLRAIVDLAKVVGVDGFGLKELANKAISETLEQLPGERKMIERYSKNDQADNLLIDMVVSATIDMSKMEGMSDVDTTTIAQRLDSYYVGAATDLLDEDWVAMVIWAGSTLGDKDKAKTFLGDTCRFLPKQRSNVRDQLLAGLAVMMANRGEWEQVRNLVLAINDSFRIDQVGQYVLREMAISEKLVEELTFFAHTAEAKDRKLSEVLTQSGLAAGGSMEDDRRSVILRGMALAATCSPGSELYLTAEVKTYLIDVLAQKDGDYNYPLIAKLVGMYPNHSRVREALERALSEAVLVYKEGEQYVNIAHIILAWAWLKKHDESRRI